MSRSRWIVALVSILALGRISLGDTPTTQQMEDKLERLQQQVDQLQKKEAEQNAAAHPTAPQRAESSAPGAPAHDAFTTIFLDNKPIELPGDIKAGYDGGFYLQQNDDFKIQFNGLVDLRYTFEQSTNKTPLTTTSLGTSHIGDLSGFNLFNGEFSAQGFIFKHIFFKAMGNFGSLSTPTSPQAGEFGIGELYAGYEFAPEFRIRGGSMIVPLFPLRGITNYGGLMFPDISDAVAPMLPGYMLGIGVQGNAVQDSISYDLQVGNGSNSQNLIDSTLPGAGRDNRIAVYTREQFAGAGKTTDFLEESDLQNHQQLVWEVGGGFGFESQNASATAFPGSQSSLAIVGLSSATGPGFGPKYTVNGQIERYVLDFRTKYQGWSVFGEAAYQHIQSNGGAFIAGYPKNSIGQIGYSIESGYFVLPKKLEVAGRFSQLYTDGLAHTMDEYEVGLNYYPFGQNLKVQLAETYVPRQAAFTSNNGIVANTQDWITQVQFQLKF